MSAVYYSINQHLPLKDSALICDRRLEPLCDHVKQSQHLLPNLILIIKTINTASIGLIVRIEAGAEAVEEALATAEDQAQEKISKASNNNSRRSVTCARDQDASLQSIPLKNKRRHTINTAVTNKYPT